MKNKNICMLLHAYLPRDNRPRKEAMALLQYGYSVDVICLKDSSQSKNEVFNGINIYRLPVKHNREGGKISYIIEYLSFTLLSFFRLATLFLKKRYAYIHVHNPPDTLIFSAVPFRLFGTKIIFDVHDPNPEMFAQKMYLPMNHPTVKMWVLLEKITLKLANKVIAVDTINKKLLSERGNIPEDKIAIVMNVPDPKIFKHYNVNKKEFGLDGKFIFLYQGTIMQGRGLENLINAFAKIYRKNVHLIIIGDGPHLSIIRNLINRCKIRDKVMLTGHVMIDELGKYTTIADVCLIPFESTPLIDIAVPNKLFEYMYYKKPILSSATPGIRSIVSDKEVLFFQGGNEKDLKEKMEFTIKNFEKLKLKTRRYNLIIKEYNWDVMKKNLKLCYER